MHVEFTVRYLHLWTICCVDHTWFITLKKKERKKERKKEKVINFGLILTLASETSGPWWRFCFLLHTVMVVIFR